MRSYRKGTKVSKAAMSGTKTTIRKKPGCGRPVLPSASSEGPWAKSSEEAAWASENWLYDMESDMETTIALAKTP